MKNQISKAKLRGVLRPAQSNLRYFHMIRIDILFYTTVSK